MYQELKNNLDNVIRQSVARGEVAGANLLIYQNQKEIIYSEAGYADLETRKPLQRDTIFRMYSMTKPVTAAATMILIERGLLDPYQPVSDFLPVFARQQVEQNGHLTAPARPMMIQDLLSMTSGLVYPGGETLAGRCVADVFDEAIRRLDSEQPMTTQELANRLGQCPLAFSPGEHWQYGTSADVLGAVIELVSGKNFSSFIEEEILKPLGMNDTAFFVPQEKQHRLATAYETRTDASGQVCLQPYTGNNLAIQNNMKKAPAFVSGGAGLASTLDDYMKFAQMLQNRGSLQGTRILQENTVDFLTHAQLLPTQYQFFQTWVGTEGYTYGNLMRRCICPEQHKGLCAAGEYGWDGWLGMYFTNLPKENITILMGTQKTDAGTFSLTRKLRNVALSHLL